MKAANFMEMKLNCPVASNIGDVTARHSVEIFVKEKANFNLYFEGFK